MGVMGGMGNNGTPGDDAASQLQGHGVGGRTGLSLTLNLLPEGEGMSRDLENAYTLT